VKKKMLLKILPLAVRRNNGKKPTVCKGKKVVQVAGTARSYVYDCPVNGRSSGEGGGSNLESRDTAVSWEDCPGLLPPKNISREPGPDEGKFL